MSDGNGTQVRQSGGWANIMKPQQPSFADMSSHQRSESLDNMARQIADLTAANRAIVAHVNTLTEQNLALKKATEILAARVDADARSPLAKLFSLVAGR